MACKEEILHICVIGFHHKKGCQLEFSYPTLETLPEQWKHLPSLAMPDGAHNFAKDTVYFHLPGHTLPTSTVFGVSCFQQIPLDKVKNRTSDMTRGTVQKAVCVLATAPLFGYIQVKMELITAAFFEAGDFSETSLLVDAFHHMRDCLPGSMVTHIYDGLSVRDLVTRFRHRTLLLFKLLLLERKVVLFQSPVAPLCTTLLSLLSLHHGLLQSGLTQAACGSPLGSPIKETTPKIYVENIEEINTQVDEDVNGSELEQSSENNSVVCNGGASVKQTQGNVEENDKEYGIDALLVQNDLAQDSAKNKTSTGCDIGILENLDLCGCGVPLALFGKGNLCFPYLSISYLDYLTSPSIRGFLCGATNVLFKQKRALADVLVEIEESRIVTSCPELRRQLELTTEDLRFMEMVMSNQQEDGDCETWIRSHFSLYLVSLLRTSLLPEGSRESDNFNPHFMAAWKVTHNYKMWFGTEHDSIMLLPPGHPAAGALSVQDVKVRLSHFITSESGRKLNQAVTSTGRAVGGAVTQAKGALSGWWNSFTQEQKTIKSVDHL